MAYARFVLLLRQLDQSNISLTFFPFKNRVVCRMVGELVIHGVLVCIYIFDPDLRLFCTIFSFSLPHLGGP